MEKDYRQSSAAPVQNPRDELHKKVSAAFEAYRSDWLRKSPKELLDISDEIYTVTQMSERLCNTIADEDAAYLLRFENPLEVVSDYWNGLGIMDSHLIAGEMRHMVWDIRSRGDAEIDYELDPDHTDAPNENGMEELS